MVVFSKARLDRGCQSLLRVDRVPTAAENTKKNPAAAATRTRNRRSDGCPEIGHAPALRTECRRQRGQSNPAREPSHVPPATRRCGSDSIGPRRSKRIYRRDVLARGTPDTAGNPSGRRSRRCRHGLKKTVRVLTRIDATGGRRWPRLACTFVEAPKRARDIRALHVRNAKKPRENARRTRNRSENAFVSPDRSCRISAFRVATTVTVSVSSTPETSVRERAESKNPLADGERKKNRQNPVTPSARPRVSRTRFFARFFSASAVPGVGSTSRRRFSRPPDNTYRL